ncbi:MAG: hypothetical protein HXY46_00910 [Syntrophaceae bacterium]|nr:hypothetical protein [Syntrophaceae bacterium]
MKPRKWVTDRFEGRGGVGMKVFRKKSSDLKRAGPTQDLFSSSSKKIPCESNCPHMVITDTLNCRKELEGLVDMEEVRSKGRCPFWPHEDRESK